MNFSEIMLSLIVALLLAVLACMVGLHYDNQAELDELRKLVQLTTGPLAGLEGL